MSLDTREVLNQIQVLMKRIRELEKQREVMLSAMQHAFNLSDSVGDDDDELQLVANVLGPVLRSVKAQKDKEEKK